MEIYKDEYASVYFGLTIWWGKKQGSQGAHYTLCITHYTHLASHIIPCALHSIHDLHIVHCTVLGFALYLGHSTIYTLDRVQYTLVMYTCTALEQVLHFSNFQTSDLPHWANQRIAHRQVAKTKSRQIQDFLPTWGVWVQLRSQLWEI